MVRRAPRIERPARVRMRRRKPWVLARRRLFGWKVRLLTRRLLAFGTTGLRSFGRCVLPAVAVQKTRCSDIVPRLATNWLTAPRRTSAAAGDPSLGSHNFPRTRAKPFTVSRTVDNLDAGTQHRAVGDSTEPRYGAAVGAVKPAPQREANPGRPVPDNAITAAQVSPGPARPGNHRWVDRSVCRAGGDAVTRHARPDKKCPARCGQPLAARPTGLLASPVVGRLPYPSRARSASLRAAPR